VTSLLTIQAGYSAPCRGSHIYTALLTPSGGDLTPSCLFVQDLGRDPAELLSKQQANVQRLQERREGLMEAAPGQNIDVMAAAGGW